MDMASSMGKCSKCGKILKNNIKYTSNGKVYCYDCYKDVADDLVVQESKKTKIYSYIEKLFKVKKLDEYLVDSISRLIKEDKKTEDGVCYTLYYIYEVKEMSLEIEYIIPNIKKYYQEAKEYHDLQLKIQLANQNVKLESEPVVVKIKKTDLDAASKPKFNYNMEDL